MKSLAVPAVRPPLADTADHHTDTPRCCVVQLLQVVLWRAGRAAPGAPCDVWEIATTCQLTSGSLSRTTVVVMAFNHHVVIQAQKVLDDGSVSDTFTHKSLFPEDMDPLSLCGTLHADGTLVVSVRRASASGGQEALAGPTYRSEAYL
ncbi:hypothetical protein fugu_010654 [Takifugu bimaculatus]|uniref:SHSP domain-containing protein n=1 Tax=Takifugu bimaculatus TaxID=433685 RepID=A0A4Z2CAK5_9TELE|nr:hypothetical protein fugu_010654 [Takifugu bimaculatus]